MSSLVIGVNYRTDEHAATFARSLTQYGEEVAAMIVDNSDTPGRNEFAARIHSENQKACVLQAPRNLGYFGAANLGLKHYLARADLPKWVLVCNVDIEFRDEQFFSDLEELDLLAHEAVVAPRIWSNRWARDLNPKISQRPTRERMRFYRVIFGNYYLQLCYETLSFVKDAVRWLARKMRGHIGDDLWTERSTHGVPSIYAPHGSCMVFHRKYFECGGDLNYSVFLFGEEIFVAEMVRRLSLRVRYCPWLCVFDNEHASTGILRTREIAGYMKDATNYLVENYFA